MPTWKYRELTRDEALLVLNDHLVDEVVVSIATDIGDYAPEIGALIAELQALRWTGRTGYPVRTMVGMALAKSIYGLSTWTRTVRLVREHSELRAVLGSEAPSEWACYRFARKLREHSEALADCLDRVIGSLAERFPELGRDVAIDG